MRDSRAMLEEQAASLRSTVEQLQQAAARLFGDPACGQVLRVKGFAPTRDGWLELNASRDAMTLKPIAKAQEVIIVIGEQLNRAAIEAHWKEV